MKKSISISIVLCLLVGIFSGCGKKPNFGNNKKLNIVTTIFPEYDWVREVLGDNEKNVNLTMLLDSGVDLHSYQPTADDIIKISTCDMFVYVGGESDLWVKDALKGAVNKDMVVINLMDVLGDLVKTEELVEGMQQSEHDDEKADEEYDEHVWLSLKNAEIICKTISQKLGVIDSGNKELYNKNALAYVQKLNALDKEYTSVVEDSKNKTILFGDRFPFRYLTDDYKISYYAAFEGCSAETEASFETITFLANKADELGFSTILTTEGRKHRIAETIIENAKNKNIKVKAMNSFQSITDDDIKNGLTYFSVMEKNLDVLKEAIK